MDYDLFKPFVDMKAQGTWPLPWTSAVGLVPEIAGLGNDIIGCEIGVSYGINLIYFLDNLPNIKQVIAIDPYSAYDDRICGGRLETDEFLEKVYQAFLVNLKGYEHRVKHFRLPSAQAVHEIEDESLDYVFIDGDHNYEFVIEDLKNYYPKVKTGGIFAGHDIQSLGVQKALSEFIPTLDMDIDKLKSCANQTWYWYK